MSVFIDKQFSGLPHHAILEDGMIKWSATTVDCNYVWGKPGESNSLEPVLKLFDVECPKLIPESVKKSFEECGYQGEVPWSYVISRETFRDIFSKFQQKLEEYIEVIDDSDYPPFFCETNILFSLLKGSFIDGATCKKILEKNDSHALKNIVSMSTSERLPTPLYDRVSTKTGRLTIKSGPQILTLNKEYRRIFRPSIPENKLYEVDFVSLEPRVALNIANKKSASDVYTSFATDCGLDISREVAKLAVLCSLYGAGKYKLESVLRKDGSNLPAARLLSKVKEYFGINDLSNGLMHKAKSGQILNYFGRPIQVDDTRKSTLLNNFLQSTAADIALLGFLDFCRNLSGLITPTFIIHDALVFEASPEHLGQVSEYVNKGFDIPKMGNFPLKITEFSCNE